MQPYSKYKVKTALLQLALETASSIKDIKMFLGIITDDIIVDNHCEIY